MLSICLANKALMVYNKNNRSSSKSAAVNRNGPTCRAELIVILTGNDRVQLESSIPRDYSTGLHVSDTHTPIRVGLVGAGPWASLFHAEMWADSAHTRLSGIWSRNTEAADSLAMKHSSKSARSFDELLAESDVIAFAVAPAAQYSLALRAVEADKHVVLEKPIAHTLGHARELTTAVEQAGVKSMVIFTSRYSPAMRDYLDRAKSFGAFGARAIMLTSALLDGPFSHSPWRNERGALLDIGPHVLDLVTAALGPASYVQGHRSDPGWISLQIGHQNGATSEVTLSCHVVAKASRYSIEIYGEEGVLEIDPGTTADQAALHANIAADLASVVRGAEHPCDARRGLYVQTLIQAAEDSIVQGYRCILDLDDPLAEHRLAR
jgi:predicted dehydrogenase